MEISIDIEDLVARVVDERLAALGFVDEWMNADQAAAYLKIKTSTLHNAVSAGKLPRHGEPGCRLRFRRAELDAYATGRRS